MFASAGDDGVVNLWDTSSSDWTKLRASSSLTAKKEINCVSFSHSGQLLAFGSNDLGARLCDIPNKRAKILTDHTAAVLSVQFSKDDSALFTGTRDCKIRQWDTSNGYCCSLIPCFSGCKSLATSGRYLSSGHIDGNSRLWDVRSNNPLIHTFSGLHFKSILSLSISPDENMLLCAAADSVMTLLDMRTYQLVHKFEDHSLVSTRSGGFLSPDGLCAVRGSDNGNVYSWNTYSGIGDSPLPSANQSAITAVSWSSSGLLASCDTAGSLVVRKKS